MKKFIAIVALAIAPAVFAASETQYKVYDLSLSLTTSKAAGVASMPCGDEDYVYRTKSSRKVKGVLAGCGCEAALGDPTCQNFAIYLWDETTKTQLTNFTYETKILQRIGKKGGEVEQVVTIAVDDPAGEKFEITLAGFGTYKASKNDAALDVVKISGGVTGTLDAPFLTVRGSGCGPCGEATPDETTVSTALVVCDCACSESDTADVTPVYGKYTFKANSKKAAKAEKNGATAKVLGLPSYVKDVLAD